MEASRLERLSIASAGVVKLGLRESFQYVSKLGIPKFLRFKHVRCNPDVAPRLTSGGYEDKVEVISPTSILFIGGGEL